MLLLLKKAATASRLGPSKMQEILPSARFPNDRRPLTTLSVCAAWLICFTCSISTALGGTVCVQRNFGMAWLPKKNLDLFPLPQPLRQIVLDACKLSRI